MRLGLICSLPVLLLTACSHQQPPPEPESVPVRLTAVEEYSPANGSRYSASLLPNRQVNLSFKTSGFVQSIYQVKGVDGRERNVDMGDIVQRGTVLGRIRSQDYRYQVDQVQGQVQQARDTERTTAAQLVQAQAAALKASEDFGRAESLYAKSSLTKSDFDAAKANRDSTAAQVRAAQSQHESASSAVRSSEAVLGNANLSLHDTALVAPFSGVILQRSIEIGSLTGPSALAFVLADISVLKAAFAISDLALPNVRKGARTTLHFEAFPDRVFDGFISTIGPTADTSTRSFQVEVTMPNHAGVLRPGMIASLNLGPQRNVAAVLVAPLDAIVPGKSGAEAFAVMTVENGVAHRKPIAIGTTYGDRIAVTGLRAGDKVVSSGAAFTSDGETVTVLP
jgi:multidrug efflux pump subunit AcrA (membrane-fusion protein)